MASSPARRPVLGTSLRLGESPRNPASIQQQLNNDFDRFVASGLPSNIEGFILDRYGLSLQTAYAGIPIKNPWGKASGQLSTTPHQIEEDAEAGLGFCVLKTVIAQDHAGHQSMSAWAIPETRMVVEKIRGRTGTDGWTVTWIGRGWSGTFAEYLALFRHARAVGQKVNMLVVPSCKFHLPGPEESEWRTDEYAFTVDALLRAWSNPTDPTDPTDPPDPTAATNPPQPPAPMPLEKDFSPTLAGSDRAGQQDRIIEWLRKVPPLIRTAAGDHRAIRVGLKLFNAMFEDTFQVRMLDEVHGAGPSQPDFIVYANRLFDPDRVFHGHRGVAYGGPDLSERNLRTLDAFLTAPHSDRGGSAPLELSATGDIHSGRMAAEYLLRGATSFQIHTYFQLPSSEFVMHVGNKVQKALHLLYFHPRDGFIAWAHHLADLVGMRDRPIRLPDLAAAARQWHVATLPNQM